jgi:uncharacterized protein YbbC (DUF1343 family)
MRPMTIAMEGPVRTGLDVLRAGGGGEWRGARAGLICHPAAVAADLSHAADVLAALDLELACLFGPQHGARGEKQDNMIESDCYRDPRTGLPVHSLYGAVRRPTAAMLDGLEVLFCDLQDVGVRAYTFAWTMVLAAQACREAGTAFVVLDRPDPIGGAVREGPLLRPGFESFIGLHPVPLRHGLTIGELARLWARSCGAGEDGVAVVAAEGWRRAAWHDETGLPWVQPSPNLPTLDSCTVYPGTVLVEGTNLSEGRGTTRPFEVIGAPFLEAHAFAAAVTERELPGVRARACWFEPTFDKHAGTLCGGLQLHVTDRAAFRPVLTGVTLIDVARRLAPAAFAWRPPPFEYEDVIPPIDLLWGSAALRTALDAGRPPDRILADTAAELAAFEEEASPLLIYR